MWDGCRPPTVHLGRPYVCRRRGRWLVLLPPPRARIGAAFASLPDAATWAGQWAGFTGAWTGERAEPAR